MNHKSLERKCVERFGKETGRILFDVMIQIAHRDFCVATAWNAYQVSIARSCNMRGKIFNLTPDYKYLILPNKQALPIKELSYSDISYYLPKSNSYGEVRHCYFDQI